MKDVSHVDVQYIAGLARLDLTEHEIARYGPEIDAVLDYMEELRDMDLDQVEPSPHATPRQNVMRDDTPAACVPRSLVIDNAPAAVEDQYIRVPPVIGDGDSPS